jgi:hypothetical protein
MPTRKQRRRRAKEQRHEYVWEDAEGNELEPDEIPVHKAETSSGAHPRSSGGRGPQPPSWRRTLRRGLIFAPIMFVVVSVLSKDLSLAQKLVNTALIAVVFLPFSYFLDGLFWRTYQRRAKRVGHSDGHRRS